MRHVFSNLRQGLRRNLSMHAAVVLTLFVSLSLAGVGYLFSQQAETTREAFGSELQLTVYLCADGDTHGCTGRATEEQIAAVEAVVTDNPEVASFYRESAQQFFDRAQELDLFAVGEDGEAATAVRAEELPESIWITLRDPEQDEGIASAVQNLDGVDYLVSARDVVGPVYTVLDVLRYGAWGAAGVLLLAAVLLVANTIRLAALARRKEIEIMRLVGASRFFIVLPFLLESLVNALVGVLLAGGALALFVQFAIVDGISDRLGFLPFVGWPEYLETLAVVAIVGPLLTVVPTLLLTRKYLRI